LSFHDVVTASPAVDSRHGKQCHGNEKEAQGFINKVSIGPHHSAVVEGLLDSVVVWVFARRNRLDFGGFRVPVLKDEEGFIEVVGKAWKERD